MEHAGSVWIDHSELLLRLGIRSYLREASFEIAGESVGLRPCPDPAAHVLLFELDAEGAAVRRAAALAKGTETALVGLLADRSAHDLRALQKAGLVAALEVRTLTAARLVTCVRTAIQRRRGLAPGAHGALGGPAPAAGQLTNREFDVLRLLAEGATTRDIAEHMNYSERTVKNIVRDVLLKLRTRTRAHAVAVAARQGVI